MLLEKKFSKIAKRPFKREKWKADYRFTSYPPEWGEEQLQGGIFSSIIFQGGLTPLRGGWVDEILVAGILDSAG